MPNHQTITDIPDYTSSVYQGKRTKYAIVIPVINEGERIRTQLRRMSDINLLVDAVIVDGGSTDGSLDEVYLRKHGVRALLTKTGQGKLSAQLRIGLHWCLQEGYEGVILIDGNNKDDPSAVELFVQKLEDDFDHVQGSRFVTGGRMVNNPVSRLLGIKLLHAPAISIAAGVRYTDTTNGFRAYSRRFLLDPRVQPFRSVFSAYELHYYLAIQAGRLGFKVCEVPVTREYPDGEIPTKISKYRGNMLILQTLWRACTGFYNPDTPPVNP